MFVYVSDICINFLLVFTLCTFPAFYSFIFYMSLLHVAYIQLVSSIQPDNQAFSWNIYFMVNVNP